MQAVVDGIVLDVHTPLHAEFSSVVFQEGMVALLDAVQHPEDFRRVPGPGNFLADVVDKVAQVNLPVANLHEQGLGEAQGQYMMVHDPVHGRKWPGRGDADVYTEMASTTRLPEQLGKVALRKTGVDNDGAAIKPPEKPLMQTLG